MHLNHLESSERNAQNIGNNGNIGNIENTSTNNQPHNPDKCHEDRSSSCSGATTTPEGSDREPGRRA